MGGENNLGREEEEPQPRQQLDKSPEEDWAWRTVFQKGFSLIPWKVKEKEVLSDLQDSITVRSQHK